MVQKISQIGNTTIEYFVHGVAPRLLITSGIHGDEFEVISAVQQMVEDYKDSLPDFVYIPRVSPSAVRQQTRTNSNGTDVNRAFREENPEEEIQAIQEILRQFHFKLAVSFHEDVEYSLFYLYDSGAVQDSFWQNVQQGILKQGVSLLTGVDDAADPDLGYEFTQGYCLCPFNLDEYDGSLEHWGQKEGVIEQWIMPEIPSSLKMSKKKAIVDILCKELLVPYFTQSLLEGSELREQTAFAVIS